MKLPNDHDSDLRWQLEAYFDGELSSDARAELENRLRREPETRRLYWEVAQWHATLSAWGRQREGQELAQHEFPRARPIAPWVWTALGMAAGLALAFAVWWNLHPRAAVSTEAAAQITFERGAEWAPGAAPREGAMPAGNYRLVRGMVRFDTTAGAAVTLAAPAAFRLASGQQIALSNGCMTSRMLRTGSRLSVAVGGMVVRDLGTAFGIDARDPRQTLVSVFDGLVAVAQPGAGTPAITLTQGESAIDRREGAGHIERADYAPDAFKNLWPLTVGINEASSRVDFLPPGPIQRPLRDFHENDKLFLLPERQNVETLRPTPVDISPATPNWPAAPVTPYPLARGARLNSYLVFFQPDPASLGTVRHLGGSVVFRNRVLGIICSDQWLDATDENLGSTGVDYTTPHQHRGLEEADKDNYRGARLPHDSVRLDPDGHTVRFDFYVSDEREQLRILVASE